MAFEKPVQILSFTAASDMSAASMQFCLVNLSATGAHLSTAVADRPIGVLQNSPARGELAEVMVLCVSKLRVGGTDIALDAAVGPDTTGRAAALTVGSGASTTAYICGRVIDIGAADNDAALVTALINCANLNRAL
jgi:hypothetical protein